MMLLILIGLLPVITIFTIFIYLFVWTLIVPHDMRKSRWIARRPEQAIIAKVFTQVTIGALITLVFAFIALKVKSLDRDMLHRSLRIHQTQRVNFNQVPYHQQLSRSN